MLGMVVSSTTQYQQVDHPDYQLRIANHGRSLNITIIEGNGAEFSLSPNFNLPRKKRISAFP